MAAELGEKGWLGVGFPREYGGLARPKTHQLIFKDEMTYHRVGGIDFIGLGLAGPIILHAGTPEQKARHIPPIVKGQTVWCQGFSEPDAGSDLGALRTMAVQDGSDFVVNGQKIWTSSGHRADWMALLCRTAPHVPAKKGLSLLLVDMRSPGVEARPIVGITGGADLSEVFFQNVRVPAENLVGERDKGWDLALAMMTFERSGIERVAGAKRLLDDIVDWIKTSRPASASFQSIRSRLAELEVECAVARLMAYRVAWTQERGANSISEAAQSKIVGSELLQKVSHVGMQVLGLHGQLATHLHREATNKVRFVYLSSIGRAIGAGTSEIQRNTLPLSDWDCQEAESV